jgi:hypothetical protein
MTDAPTPVIFIHGLWLHPLSWTEWHRAGPACPTRSRPPA